MNAYDALIILKKIRKGTVIAGAKPTAKPDWTKDLDKVIKWLEQVEIDRESDGWTRLLN